MAKEIKYAVIFEKQASAWLSVPLDNRGINTDCGVIGFSTLEDAREFLDIVVRSSADDAGLLISSSEDEVRVGYDQYESGLVSIKEIKLLW